MPDERTADPKRVLRDLFDAAVDRADPMTSLSKMLPDRPEGKLLVVGAGKASARMAEALEAAWGPCEGLVITRYGYARACRGIEIVEAAHPTPDQSGVDASRRMLEMARSLGPSDTLVCLISGGASSLLTLPPEGVNLQELQQITRDMLHSGAAIEKINAVRRHLCSVKGGRLAAAAFPATVQSFIMSDVPGDDLAFVGSGPTVGHDSTADDALRILRHHVQDIPKSVHRFLEMDRSHVTAGDPLLERTKNVLFVSPSEALAAARERAEALGLDVIDLGSDLEGEARTVAAEHARLARDHLQHRASGEPLVLLSGGELTVTRRGDGVGGPNAEYALALAIALDATPGVHAIACDTDGVDGAADVAGATIGPATLATAEDKGLSAEAALDRNDAHSFFAEIGAQVVTGPTLTNVNDFRAILVDAP